MARPVPPTQPPSDRAVCCAAGDRAGCSLGWRRAGARPAGRRDDAGVALAGGISRARPLAFGVPYLGLAAVALVWLRQPPMSGGANVIVLLLIVWASDIGAYMTGRAIGGPLLAPSISPGKTWSGAIGGLAAAGSTGLAASLVLGSGPISWRPAGFALLIGVISQIGDLFESRLKRHFGVKDSGTTIPGHGGLLDRLDAVLTAAPTAALLALIAWTWSSSLGMKAGHPSAPAGETVRSVTILGSTGSVGTQTDRAAGGRPGPLPGASLGRWPQRGSAGRTGDRLACRDRRCRRPLCLCCAA